MSIKYSEILAADEVLSAGANDIIVLAIVDGGAPTGYTTKAIKVTNFLSGVTPNLQTVATAGSSANITTSFNVFVTDNTVELYSVNGTTGDTAAIIMDSTSNSGFTYADGTFGESTFIINASIMQIGDSLNLQGLSYLADYSAQGIIAYGDRWIPDKGYVDSVAGGDGNGIFDVANDGGTIPISYEADLTDTLNIGANTFFISKAIGGVGINTTAVTGGSFRVHGLNGGQIASFRNHLGTTQVMYIENDSTVRIDALNADSYFSIGNTLSTLIKLRVKGKSGDTWLTRMERNTGSIAFEVLDSGNVAARTSAGNPLFNTDATGVAVAFGHGTPTAGTVHFKDIDLLVEGGTDLNLLNIDESTNQFAVGSTPFANVKASFTNNGALTYSFLVLNSDTTKNFQVMETGVVATNGQILVNLGVTPTSASAINCFGDIEIPTAKWHYFGDPTTDGSYRMGADGIGNLVIEERIATVWTNLQTW